MSRKVMDCRNYPSESNCTLTITGEEEVLRAATDHATSLHGHKDSPQFREKLRAILKDEEPVKAQVGRWVA